MKAKFFKHFVRAAAVVTAFSVFSATPCVMAAEVSSASAEVRDAKISSYLKSELEDLKSTDKVKISVWLKDIDHDSIKEKATAKAGVSEEQMNERSAQLMQQDNLVAKQSLLSNLVIDQRAELSEDVDNYIKCIRSENRKAITAKSSKVVSQLKIEDNIIFQGEYAPMMMLEVNAEDIDRIADNPEVESVDILDDIKPVEYDDAQNASTAANVAESDLDLIIQKSAISASNYPNSTYNGSGVMIGQLEGGRAEYSSTYFNKPIKYVGQTASVDPGDIDHATHVARILAGKESMTPYAELHSAGVDIKKNNYTYTSKSFCDRIENFADKGIHLVNISWGWSYINSNNRTYEVIEKFLDYMVIKNDLILVTAAGNNKNSPVISPACAYNVITVGGIDTKNSFTKTDDTVYNHSYSYNNNNVCSKPDILAPATYYFGGIPGTSFAAPLTVSAIALMLENQPSLRYDPLLVKAILIASCDRKVKDPDLGNKAENCNGITQKQGAGVINLSRAMEIINNQTYKTGVAYSTEITHDANKVSSTSSFTAGLTWDKYIMVIGNIENVGDRDDNGKLKDPFGEYPITNLNLSLSGLATNNVNYGHITSSVTQHSSTEHIFAENPLAYRNKYRLYIYKPTANEYSPRYALAWD